MKKTLAVAIISLSLATHAQTLLYQWSFTNVNDTATNSIPTYAATAGTGVLNVSNVTGNVFGSVGLDGINPLAYFTNSNNGPGFGSGANAMGAYALNGQGYSGGNTAVAIASDLNIADQSQFTLTFWVRLDGAWPIANGQLPRLVEVGASKTYDAGGKGTGNVNGVGTSLNANPGTQGVQNGMANGSGGAQNTVMSCTNAFPTSNGGVGGMPEGSGTFGSGTWVFEAISYDGSLTSSNFTTWLGATNQVVVKTDQGSQNANYGIIHFSTNATIVLGNDNSSSAPRAVTIGAVADVRFYSGVVLQPDLDRIRQFQTPALTNQPAQPPAIASQPVSGRTLVGGSRTFTVAASGNPNVFTYLWRSNGTAVFGGTNASLTISNVQPIANGATFICSVTNTVGGTNTAAAMLAVVSPAPGSYAQAVYTNNPYSFWFVNEASNNVVTIYDYASGKDGAAVNPPNNVFLSGPSSPPYPGFPATNSSIETVQGIASQLNLGNPVNFPNTGMTICGWVQAPSVANANGIIFDLISDTAGGFGLTFSGGAVSYQWGQNPPASGFTSGVTLNTNDWTFVALVVTTNLTPDDIANSITADTNATVYVGSHLIGLQGANDSTALNGDEIDSGTSSSVLALGRTTVSASENGLFYAINTSQFSSVAVFYTALSPQTITNLYLKGAGLYLTGGADPNTAGNVLTTFPLGTLQSANSITGPWNDVTGAASPYSEPMTNSQRFYRLRY